MPYISNPKMILAKITKKANFLKKNYTPENSEKCQKNPKKYWKNSHKYGKCPKCEKKLSKYSNKWFCWLKNLGNFPKKFPEIPEYIYIFYKN